MSRNSIDLSAAAVALSCSADRDGSLRDLGEGWSKLLGWSENELRTTPCIDFVHPEDRDATLSELATVWSCAKLVRFVNRFRCKTGGYRWLDWSASVDPSDGLLHALIRDVTEERRALAHAAALEQMSGIGSWDLDVTTGEAYWSPAMFRIFGVDPETFVPTIESMLAGSAADQATGLRVAIDRLLATGESFDTECIIRCADGAERETRAVGAAEVIDGRVIRACGAFQGMPHRAPEKAHSSARSQLQSAIEALPDAFVLFDAEDRVVAFNEQHRRLFQGMDEFVRPGITFEALLRRALELDHFPDAIGREDEWLSARLAAHRRPSSVVEQSLSDGRWLRIVENKTPDGGRVGLRIDVTELKRQEQRLADIIAGTNVGTWEHDLREGKTFYNERWAQMIGYTLEELSRFPGCAWEYVAHRRDADSARQKLQAHLRGETAFYEAEVRLRHKDGRWIWVLDRGRVARRDAEGRPEWMSGTHLDITERKEAEFAREESRNRLQATLDAIPDLIFELDEEGVFIGHHSGSETSQYQAPEAFLGRPISEVMPPDVVATGMAALREAFATGRSIGKRYSLRMPDGDRWYEISAARKQAGEEEKQTCILMVRDVTAQQNAQADIEYKEQLLRGLFELSQVGMSLNDPETGAFLDVNSAMVAQTGYSREELLKLDYYAISPPEYQGTVAHYFAQNPGSRHFGPFEEEHCHKDGSRRPVVLRGMLLDDRNGRKLLWSVVEDISERKSLQAALTAERDFLDQIMQTSISAVTALDENGVIVFANRAAEEILGISRSRVEGRRFDAPEWRITALDGGEFPEDELPFAIVMATGEPVFDVRHAIEWPDGSRRILSINAAPLQKTAGIAGRVVCSIIDVTERIATEERIRSQTREDALTQLANRKTLLEELEAFTIDRRRRESAGALLLLDLDYFKETNDTLGHMAGDALLKEIALRLRESVRSNDLVARLGGDEFAIILRDMHREEDVETVAGGILERVRRPFRIADRTIIPSISIGVAQMTSRGMSADDLYRNADSALYDAKESGRNGWSLFDRELSRRIERRKEIAVKIGQTIVSQRLQVAYQPQVRLDTKEHTGFEALPLAQGVDPFFLTKEYFGIAEDTGQIIAIGDQVLEQAMAEMAYLVGRNLDPGRVALDIFPAQLKDRDFVARISAMLASFGLSAYRLELEIAENIVLDRSAALILESLRKLTRLGVTICLDDFGTGAASLSHLTQFPIRSLKIDRSFVAALGEKSHASRIPGTIISIAHNLGLSVVADGVDTDVQYNALSQAGCDSAQGAVISVPLTDGDSVAEYLASQKLLRAKEKIFIV